MAIKYAKELLEEAVAHSVSYAGVLRYLSINGAGYNQSHIKRRIVAYNINTTHFTGQAWSKGKRRDDLNRKTKEEVLQILPEGSLRVKSAILRRSILESGIEYQCSLCPIESIWNDLSITLEIDHIDSNWLDNRLENLRFLCPNCHSQQSTSKPHKYTCVVQLVETYDQES